MKRIVILGCGTIGKAILENALRNQIQVTVIDRNPRLPGLSQQVIWHTCDLQEATQLLNFIRNADVVYDCTSVKPVDIQARFSEALLRQKLLLKVLVETISQINNCKLVTLSSAAVYGELIGLRNFEDTPVDPINKYGILKVLLEEFLLDYSRDRIDFVIARISNPFGTLINPDRAQDFISKAIIGASRGHLVPFVNGGNIVRDFIHLDDVAYALLRLGFTPLQSNIYNVSSGKGITLREIVQSVEKIYQKPIQVVDFPLKESIIKSSILDNTKLCEELRLEVPNRMEEFVRSQAETSMAQCKFP